MAPQIAQDGGLKIEQCEPGQPYRTPGGIVGTFRRIDGKPYVQSESEGTLQLGEDTKLIPIDQNGSAQVEANSLTEYQTLHACIVDSKTAIEQSFWKLGLALKDMRDHQPYRAKGLKTFEEYLESPELDMSRGTAYDLIGIVEEFRIWSYQYDIDVTSIGWGKLKALRPVFRDLQDAEQIKLLVEQARLHTQVELRTILRAYRTDNGHVSDTENHQLDDQELEGLRKLLWNLPSNIQLTNVRMPRQKGRRAKITLTFKAKTGQELLSEVEALAQHLKPRISEVVLK